MTANYLNLHQIKELEQRLDYYCQHGALTEEPLHQEHQLEAHQAIINRFGKMQKPEDWWSLMVMATGSGKSYTAGKEIKGFNTPVGAQHPIWDYPAIVATSRLLLTDQFKRDLARKVGIRESDIGVYSSKSQAKSQMDKPVLIVPYPTFLKLSKSGVLTPEKRPLLILDEAHNALGISAMKEIRESWLGKAYIQCWTATDKLAKKTVAKILFDSKTKQDEDDATYRLTLKEASERGITAPLRSMVLETGFTSGAQANAEGKFSQADEEKIINQVGRKEALIRLCRGDYKEKFGVDFYGMRTIVFAPGIEHGKALAKEFNKIFGNGYAIAVNGKETNPREMNVEKPGTIAYRFTRGDRTLGDPRIIVSDKLVEEGVDLPAAELGIEEVATYSEKVETQRVGRLTRKLNGKIAHSVVMLDKDQTGAAIIGEMEGWELKPKNFEFPKTIPPRDRPEPPLPEDFPDIPVNVVATAKEIAEFKEKRKREILPIKVDGDGWWTQDDIRKIPGGSSIETTEAMPKLKAAFDAGEGTPHAEGGMILTYKNGNREVGIRVQKMKSEDSPLPTLFFWSQHIIDAGLVQPKKKELPIKREDDGWWSAYDMRNLSGGQSTKMRKALPKLRAMFKAAEGIPHSEGGVILPYEIGIRAQMMLADADNGREFLYFWSKDIIKAGLIDPEKKPLPIKQRNDNWWSLEQIGGSVETRQTLASLVTAFKAGEGIPHPEGGLILPYKNEEGKIDIRMQEMLSGSRSYIFFWSPDIIKAKLIQPEKKTLPQKCINDGWYSIKNISKTAGGNSNETKRAIPILLAAFEAGEGKPHPEDGVILPYKNEDGDMSIRTKEMIAANGQNYPYFWGEDLLKAGLVTALPREEFRPKPIKKKDISPDSEDLKRTGNVLTPPGS